MKRNENIDTSGGSPVVVVYPKSNDIRINASELERELSTFKEAIKKSMSIEGLIALTSLWLPVFTATSFKDIPGIMSSATMKGGYFTFVLLMSFYLLNTVCFSLLKLLAQIPFVSRYVRNFIEKNETDPEKKKNIILKKCLQPDK